MSWGKNMMDYGMATPGPRQLSGTQDNTNHGDTNHFSRPRVSPPAISTPEQSETAKERSNQVLLFTRTLHGLLRCRVRGPKVKTDVLNYRK